MGSKSEGDGSHDDPNRPGSPADNSDNGSEGRAANSRESNREVWGILETIYIVRRFVENFEKELAKGKRGSWKITHGTSEVDAEAIATEAYKKAMETPAEAEILTRAGRVGPRKGSQVLFRVLSLQRRVTKHKEDASARGCDPDDPDQVYDEGLNLKSFDYFSSTTTREAYKELFRLFARVPILERPSGTAGRPSKRQKISAKPTNATGLHSSSGADRDNQQYESVGSRLKIPIPKEDFNFGDDDEDEEGEEEEDFAPNPPIIDDIMKIPNSDEFHDRRVSSAQKQSADSSTRRAKAHGIEDIRNEGGSSIVRSVETHIKCSCTIDESALKRLLEAQTQLVRASLTTLAQALQRTLSEQNVLFRRAIIEQTTAIKEVVSLVSGRKVPTTMAPGVDGGSGRDAPSEVITSSTQNEIRTDFLQTRGGQTVDVRGPTADDTDVNRKLQGSFSSSSVFTEGTEGSQQKVLTSDTGP